MRGPLRLPSTFFLDPTPVFSIIYQKIITIHPAELFFLAKMAWNAIVCETTDVSRENAIFPIFQKTWFQAILAKKKIGKKNETKKNGKKKKTRSTTVLWNAKILKSAWILQYVYVPIAVECDVPCGVRRIYGMRRILSMRGWFRDHIGKFLGQNQNSNPKANPNFQGHTSGFCFSEFTLWGPGEETG